jgi:hypothetical protein
MAEQHQARAFEWVRNFSAGEDLGAFRFTDFKNCQVAAWMTRRPQPPARRRKETRFNAVFHPILFLEIRQGYQRHGVAFQQSEQLHQDSYATNMTPTLNRVMVSDWSGKPDTLFESVTCLEVAPRHGAWLCSSGEWSYHYHAILKFLT